MICYGVLLESSWTELNGCTVLPLANGGVGKFNNTNRFDPYLLATAAEVRNQAAEH
jgi:hypothetical protein